jgi:hypothetical protein
MASVDKNPKTARLYKLGRDHRRIIDAVRATVCDERQRQIAEEGYHPDHDDAHVEGELVRAACAYLRHAAAPAAAIQLWPWESPFRPKGDQRNIVIAAALLLAELERLERRRERNEAREPPLPLVR